MTTYIDNLALEYFNSLNPMAERIYQDVWSTKEAYEDLWNTLSFKEQNQILDEAIIYPEVVLKYSLYPIKTSENKQYIDKINKLIYEEDHDHDKNESWKDEFSSPFTWMSKSQLNLNIFIQDNEKDVSRNEMNMFFKKNEAFMDPPSIVLGGSTIKIAKSKTPVKKDEKLFTKLKNKSAILKIQSLKTAVSKQESKTGEKEALVKPNNVYLNTKSKTLLKPKTPPPPPPKKGDQIDPEKKYLLQESPLEDTGNKQFVRLEKEQQESDPNNDDVPKSGFDFLDNW